MIDVQIKASQGQIRTTEELLAHIPRGAEKALARSINRTLQGIRTEVIQAVRDTYVIRAKDVRETMTIKNATADRLEGRLTSRGGTLPLERFKISPKRVLPRPKVGVRVQVRKDENPDPIGGAFLIPHKPGVFVRVGRPRLPIRKLYGPAVPSMLKTVVDQDQLQKHALDRFERELEHETDYLLTKGAR